MNMRAAGVFIVPWEEHLCQERWKPTALSGKEKQSGELILQQNLTCSNKPWSLFCKTFVCLFLFNFITLKSMWLGFSICVSEALLPIVPDLKVTYSIFHNNKSAKSSTETWAMLANIVIYAYQGWIASPNKGCWMSHFHQKTQFLNCWQNWSYIWSWKTIWLLQTGNIVWLLISQWLIWHHFDLPEACCKG